MTTGLKIRTVHICDDHQLITSSLSSIVKEINPLLKISASNNLADFISTIHSTKFDLILLDINVNGSDMLREIKKLKSLLTETKIIIITSYDSLAMVEESIQLGLKGFLNKNASESEIMSCINIVSKGGKYISRERRKEEVFKDNFELLKILTAREIDILKCLTKGLTNKMIADSLNISINTVQTHRKNIYAKLQIKGVNELVSFAYENNLYE